MLARDPAHAARLRRLRNQGRDPGADWLDHAEPGYNYRLSELACALGRVQLGRIEEMLALRCKTAERYDALLAQLPGWNCRRSRFRAASSAGSSTWFACRRAWIAIGCKQLCRAGIATGRYFCAHPSAACLARSGARAGEW